jgi:hypothetical protein
MQNYTAESNFVPIAICVEIGSLRGMHTLLYGRSVPMNEAAAEGSPA